MKTICLALAVFLAGCQYRPASQLDMAPPEISRPRPLVTWVDVPVEMRQQNWGGSCMHASMMTTLRSHGLHRMASWWGQTYDGGESIEYLADKAERAGLRYAYTAVGDTELLEWCARNRHVAVVKYMSTANYGHAVNLVGYKDGKALLIDNNRPERIFRVPWNQFVSGWIDEGGNALTVVYTPPPPKPIF